MYRHLSLLFLQQLLAYGTSATRIEALLAQPTPHIPGYVQESPPAPSPTQPARMLDLRQLARRDGATCGYISDSGYAITCADNEYCYTSASGGYGNYQCCSGTDCYVYSTCVDADNCSYYYSQYPYCATSYLYNTGTWYSGFGCAANPSETTYLVWSFEDTPAYTSQLEASSAAAQSQADASASDAAAAASSSDAAAASASEAESQASQSAAQASSEAAAKESSLSAAAASLSQIKASTQKVTVTVVTTNSQGQAETKVVESTSTTTPTAATGNGTTTEAPKKDGMSTGAIAGTAVGSIAGVALLGAGAFILFRMWKKKREDSEDENVPYMTGVQVADKGNPVHYPPPSQTYPSPPPQSYPTPPPHQYAQSPTQYSTSTHPYSMTQTGTSTPNHY